jgi:hypothetical protein
VSDDSDWCLSSEDPKLFAPSSFLHPIARLRRRQQRKKMIAFHSCEHKKKKNIQKVNEKRRRRVRNVYASWIIQ